MAEKFFIKKKKNCKNEYTYSVIIVMSNVAFGIVETGVVGAGCIFTVITIETLVMMLIELQITSLIENFEN